MKKKMLDILNLILKENEDDSSFKELQNRKFTYEDIKKLISRQDLPLSIKEKLQKIIKIINEAFNKIKILYLQNFPEQISDIVFKKEKTKIEYFVDYDRKKYFIIYLYFSVEIKEEAIEDIIKSEFKTPIKVYNITFLMLDEIKNFLEKIKEQIENSYPEINIEFSENEIYNLLLKLRRSGRWWVGEKHLKIDREKLYNNPLYITEILKKYYLPSKKAYSFDFLIVFQIKD